MQSTTLRYRIARTLSAFGAAATLSVVAASTAQAQKGLSPTERKIRSSVERHREAQVDFLERVVNINSGTLNVEGVRQVGDVFRAALDSLGFETRWAEMPESMHRAGHLIAEHKGKPGGKRILLIGHFDTVFEGEGQHFVRLDSTARGAGSADMKGGDVIILYALQALRDAGELDDANIIVVFSGDEERAGSPLEVARRDLIEAAKRSDVALAFEGGERGIATIARRGDSRWTLRVTGRQAHSSGIFKEGVGDGAIYEASRILDGFREALSSEKNLSFNPGVFVGGTDVTYDTNRVAGTAAGKLNIIARSAVVQGDLRFLSEKQKDNARAKMREIVSHHLPQTSAEIIFEDEYPAMPPTEGNRALLAEYDSVSRALGYGPVRALDPGQRGAGDVSFVAPYVDAMDGLGADGSGSHTPREEVNLSSLPMQTARAAVLIHRLTQGK
jgi:Acetylornithine deacetylase/Succinyl-diaminopimelate desuccinylase and related deacylases